MSPGYSNINNNNINSNNNNNITNNINNNVRLLNISFDIGVVPVVWRCACMMPLYKGKRDECECTEVLVC